MTRAAERLRWGVQHDFRARGERYPQWELLGWRWMTPRLPDPRYCDFWPASFRTRHEAREMVALLTAESVRHSPDWRFRAVRIAITVRVTQ